MVVRENIFTRKVVLNAVVFLMLLYFAFHSIYGERGIVAYFKLQSELENSHKTLELLRAERLHIENKTKLLRPGSLDRDMLDEKARNVLGFSKPKEMVFKTPTNQIEKQAEDKKIGK
ncbi:septum formation initiator family protein [Rickettsiaceae bacterium]|nr:septum formation initiator family protein [Rickettsiaceae bacterium]